MGWGPSPWSHMSGQRPCIPQAIQLSRDGQYLLTGGDNGVVMVWQVSDLKQLFAYPGCDAGIRAMALSHDQR